MKLNKYYVYKYRHISPVECIQGVFDEVSCPARPDRLRFEGLQMENIGEDSDLDKSLSCKTVPHVN
jgi:hypothetical protein